MKFKKGRSGILAAAVLTLVPAMALAMFAPSVSQFQGTDLTALLDQAQVAASNSTAMAVVDVRAQSAVDQLNNWEYTKIHKVTVLVPYLACVSKHTRKGIPYTNCTVKYKKEILTWNDGL